MSKKICAKIINICPVSDINCVKCKIHLSIQYISKQQTKLLILKNK